MLVPFQVIKRGGRDGATRGSELIDGDRASAVHQEIDGRRDPHRREFRGGGPRPNDDGRLSTPGPRIQFAPLNFRKTIRERFPAAVLFADKASRVHGILMRWNSRPPQAARRSPHRRRRLAPPVRGSGTHSLNFRKAIRERFPAAFRLQEARQVEFTEFS